jgi:predicted amidohydrolase YtcJ
VPHADLLFLGGFVYAGPGRGSVPGVPEALQVAIVDGRIAAVDADLSAWRGSTTKVVDLAGGMLHAGFLDAHIHPIQGGLERRGCDASRAWITGGGWAMSAFPGGTPSAADLDVVEPIRPVFLYNRDHHGA